jgi:hypothetical protein
MKRIMFAILAVGMFLPVLAAPASCSGASAVRLLAKPECLAKYGWLLPQ